MSPENLKSLARRLPEELLTQGDLSVADELFARDDRPVPSGSRLSGSQQVKRWAASLRRAFPDLCAIVEEEVAEGDTVVQRLTLSGTHAGDYLGSSATGTRINWQIVSLLRAGPGGKFAELTIVADETALRQPLRAAHDAGQTVPDRPSGTDDET